MAKRQPAGPGRRSLSRPTALSESGCAPIDASPHKKTGPAGPAFLRFQIDTQLFILVSSVLSDSFASP